MTQPSYPVARAAAPRIHYHFTLHRAESGRPEEQLAPPADIPTIEAMIDAAFWASLQREEGFVPRISLAYLAPEHVRTPMLFEQPLTLQARALSRVAPAVERPGLHLGVWPENGQFRVWGAAFQLPDSCLVIEVVAPGLLAVKHSRAAGSGKFVNIAVLQGDQVKIIDQRSSVAVALEPLELMLTLESESLSAAPVNVLIQLAVSMRAHGRGGSLLVVPSGDAGWRDSILSPVSYSVLPVFRALADSAGAAGEADATRRAVAVVAGLTAVDGATMITNRYDLLGFGVKIVRRRGSTVVSHVKVTEPVEGAEAAVVEPAQLGGARHLSAAQFVHDQRRAAALVASQDGRFTVFGWNEDDRMVRAHRIEALLL